MGNQSDFTSPDVTDSFSAAAGLIDLASEVAGILSASSIDPAIATDAEVAALILGKQATSEKGAANGYAALNANSEVVQLPADAELKALAGLISAADRVPFFTGGGHGVARDSHRVRPDDSRRRGRKYREDHPWTLDRI